MNQPRIAPGTRRQVGLAVWGFSRLAGKVARTAPPNIFLTLGRHRRLFWGWLHFAGTLMPGGKLPRRETELVILRVAHVRGCTYEFEHHVQLGKRAGVTDADVQRVVEGPRAEGWTDREQAVLAAVDELVGTRDLTDETWRALRGHLDERGCIELLLLAGHYDMLAATLTALRLQPDAAAGPS